MTDVRIATTDGTGKVLESAAVQAFRDELRGPLIGPEDTSYDETRRVWNGMIDRRPALIARCGGVADVIAAVRFARDHHLLMSVRGGGHNTPGIADCSGGCAAAAISASSPRSSIACTRSAFCWPDRCSIRSPRRGRRSRSTETSRPRFRTRSTRWRH